MAPEQQGRRDLVEYPLEDNVRLEVYWRDDRAGVWARSICLRL